MTLSEKQSYSIYDKDDYKNCKDFETKHTKMIRFRLLKGWLNYIETHDGKKLGRNSTIKELFDKGIKISPQTYDDLFNPDVPYQKINFSAVIFLCEKLGLSINQVLAFPEETDIDFDKKPKFNDFGGYFKIFDDKKYNGRFQFYTFKHSGMDSSIKKIYSNSLIKKEELIKGELCFNIKEASESTATIEYKQATFNALDGMGESSKKSTCIPLLSTVNNNVYLRFSDNDGRTYQIVFKHQEFPSGDCYFRVGGMFIESSDKDHLPIFQKILLLRKELEENQYDYIKGILNFNQDTIIISPDKLNELAENDSDIKKFVDLSREKIQFYEKKILILNREIISSDDTIEMSRFERESVLKKLLHYSYSQNSLTIKDNEYDHKIFKELQQITQ